MDTAITHRLIDLAFAIAVAAVIYHATAKIHARWLMEKHRSRMIRRRIRQHTTTAFPDKAPPVVRTVNQPLDKAA